MYTSLYNIRRLTFNSTDLRGNLILDQGVYTKSGSGSDKIARISKNLEKNDHICIQIIYSHMLCSQYHYNYNCALDHVRARLMNCSNCFHQNSSHHQRWIRYIFYEYFFLFFVFFDNFWWSTICEMYGNQWNISFADFFLWIRYFQRS